jgi:hypothetical protein
MKWIFAGAACALAVLIWFLVNPLKGFGVSVRGLTTYDLMPIPWADFEVRADGSVHLLSGKPLDLSLEDVKPMLDPKPEALIIATGWNGTLVPRPEVAAILQNYGVQILKTGDALELYNSLISEGKKVAIHVHST